MIRRYIIYILGLYVVGLGVAMILASGMGSSPISSWAYVMSLNTPWTVGTFTFLMNVMLIAGQYVILRHHGLKKELLNIGLQIPFSFLFGAFIDANMYLLGRVFTPELVKIRDLQADLSQSLNSNLANDEENEVPFSSDLR